MPDSRDASAPSGPAARSANQSAKSVNQSAESANQSTDQAPNPPTVHDLLAAAVKALGGSEREGQVAMADAVADALANGTHLLVQAGTGTGKSLAYLVPAILHGDRVVVATATIALQNQIIDRDLPALADAVEPLLKRRPTYAILKGRSNYLCKNRVYGGMPAEPEDGLFEPSPTTALGRDVVRLKNWADETRTGDRDELDPGVTDRAWRQVSVTARECLGATRCPYGQECFAEEARDRANRVDVVVTNHALLAIDALEGLPILPQHDAVVVDEAHELVDRVTGVATDELTPAIVERAAAKARRHAENADALADAADSLEDALAAVPPGRLVGLPEELATALAQIRDGARAVLTDITKSGRTSSKDGDADSADGARKLAHAAVSAVHETAERLAEHATRDVAWIATDLRRGPVLRVAPLAVNGLLRERLFTERAVVLTSATLELGGSFQPIARQVGLTGDDAPEWTGLDVGSPFDYPKQGILYVARHLAPPGRDGISTAMLDELAALLTAAGGRTLGLFSSQRAAEAAAEAMRERLDVPVLCQGDDRTALLIKAFATDPATCLFGTLSLWQGVDVPGESCSLVVIDRIPFPRPDDPLMSARQQAVADAGGNGFLTVAASHAALRLAQGAGRLIRRGSDRGVVAVLDSRLATARYGDFLRTSLPPFWATTDRDIALSALRRLTTGDAGAPG